MAEQPPAMAGARQASLGVSEENHIDLASFAQHRPPSRRRSRASPTPPQSPHCASLGTQVAASQNVPAMERLAQDLSRQSIQGAGLDRTQRPTSAAQHHAGRHPPIPETVAVNHYFAEPMDLEIDEDAHREPPPPLPLTRRNVAAVPVAQPLPIPGLPSGLESPPQPPAQAMRDIIRFARARSSHVTPGTRPRSIQARVEDMIASGSQCNVKEAPPSTPTTPANPNRLLQPEGDSMDLSCLELEVDEACNSVGSEVTWFHSDAIARILDPASLGLAGNVPGLPVMWYQTASQAAMRCPNAVRSRPRMRKRDNNGPKRPGASSRRTSRATSLASTGTNQSYPNLPLRSMAI